MSEVWPTGTFPFIDDPESYTEVGPQGNVLRTPMDAGPVKVRRRFTAAPKIISGKSAIMTSAQVVSFETWFSDTIHDGAISFTAPHPRLGTSMLFRFIGSYELEYVTDDAWRVSMSLEVLIQ